MLCQALVEVQIISRSGRGAFHNSELIMSSSEFILKGAALSRARICYCWLLFILHLISPDHNQSTGKRKSEVKHWGCPVSSLFWLSHHRTNHSDTTKTTEEDCDGHDPHTLPFFFFFLPRVLFQIRDNTSNLSPRWDLYVAKMVAVICDTRWIMLLQQRVKGTTIFHSARYTEHKHTPLHLCLCLMTCVSNYF